MYNNGLEYADYPSPKSVEPRVLLALGPDEC
jgi:hypothetical protein